jgi:hypothetical protein
MEKNEQAASGKRYTHIYIARQSDGDYDYLLTLSESRRELLGNIVRALETEELVCVDSDDEPVDVLCPPDATELAERIPA